MLPILGLLLIFFCFLFGRRQFKSQVFEPTVMTQREQYSPTICTPVDYKFTFIFDSRENRFKCHGVWLETCLECPSCGFPMCCNTDKIIYRDPYDPTNFIPTNWYNSTSNEECVLHTPVPLFEHEYYKHISCSNITNTTDFLNLAIDLYDRYYDAYVVDQCQGYNQIWLNLDANYNYVSTECVK